MTNCVEALTRWVGKSKAVVVYDSTTDEFTDRRFFDHVWGKRNIAIVALTTDGDVFGGFCTVTAPTCGCGVCDPAMFVFSFESHGRCTTPQRFRLKAELQDKAYVMFFKNDLEGWFVWFRVSGCGGFHLGHERANTYCHDLAQCFDGIENTTLTGSTMDADGDHCHRCFRLVAVQLSN